MKAKVKALLGSAPDGTTIIDGGELDNFAYNWFKDIEGSGENIFCKSNSDCVD